MKQSSTPMPYIAMLLAIALYSVMDATMKFSAIAVGAYSATFLRNVLGFALVLPLWLKEGARWPARPALILHIKRGIVAAGMAVSFFYALVRLPLAEAIALAFVAPLFALFLAAVLLGEKIERKSIWASLLGLVGVSIIGFIGRTEGTAHPEATLGIVAVLCSAFLYAWNLILQRQQALVARPTEVAVFQTAVAAITLSIAAPWLLVTPTISAWQGIAASALLATASLMLSSWAYGRAEAQALVPFEYTAFLWAALIGWLAFAEQVTIPTVLGAALIVVGCLVAAPKRRIEQTAL